MFRTTRGRSIQKDNAESPDCPSELVLPTCAASRWLRLHHLPCSFLWSNRKTTHSVQGAIRPKFFLAARCSSHRCPSRRSHLLSLHAIASRRQTDESAMSLSVESQHQVRASLNRVVVSPYPSG